MTSTYRIGTYRHSWFPDDEFLRFNWSPEFSASLMLKCVVKSKISLPINQPLSLITLLLALFVPKINQPPSIWQNTATRKMISYHTLMKSRKTLLKHCQSEAGWAAHSVMLVLDNVAMTSVVQYDAFVPQKVLLDGNIWPTPPFTDGAKKITAHTCGRYKHENSTATMHETFLKIFTTSIFIELCFQLAKTCLGVDKKEWQSYIDKMNPCTHEDKDLNKLTECYETHNVKKSRRRRNEEC